MPIFYDNKANLVVSKDDHFYESLSEPGIYYPSVTTKLGSYPKGYGFEEYLKANGFNSEIILERAGNLGKEVHNAIEQWHKIKSIRQISEDLTHEFYSWDAWKMFNKYMNFYTRFKPENLVSEFKIVSPKWKTGGTMDEIDMINNQRWLIDHKTGNNIYTTHWIQISVYAKIWTELNPQYPIDKIGILHLNADTKTDGKDGKIQGIGWQLKEPPKDIDHYIKLWDYTSALWDEENPNAKPRMLEFPIEFKEEKPVIPTGSTLF